AYTCPRVVRYPEGRVYFPEKKDPRYPDWLKAIKDESSYLWARFPFMSYEEVEGEIEAPAHLLGRWEVSDGTTTWHQAFFGDKRVVRVAEGRRYRIVAAGAWSTIHGVLEVFWEDGARDEWPLYPHPAGQTVKCEQDRTLAACTARQIEGLNVNPSYCF